MSKCIVSIVTPGGTATHEYAGWCPPMPSRGDLLTLDDWRGVVVEVRYRYGQQGALICITGADMLGDSPEFAASVGAAEKREAVHA